MILAVVIWIIRKRKKADNSDTIDEKIKPKIDLKELESVIIENRINSVEGLANHLNTNTVQLNRNFREVEITPGKFLKAVKLNYAKRLLARGNNIDEVANLIGYSSRFLKKELEEQ